MQWYVLSEMNHIFVDIAEKFCRGLSDILRTFSPFHYDGCSMNGERCDKDTRCLVVSTTQETFRSHEGL